MTALTPERHARKRRTQALNALKRNSKKIDDDDALRWAAGKSDEQLLSMRNFGVASLRWLRSQPVPPPRPTTSSRPTKAPNVAERRSHMAVEVLVAFIPPEDDKGLSERDLLLAAVPPTGDKVSWHEEEDRVLEGIVDHVIWHDVDDAAEHTTHQPVFIWLNSVGEPE
jgi:hypothetical protein